MKKTLVALAVLATAGTAFAQNAVSLTGNFGVGVQRTVVGSGAYGRPGLAVTDGGLTFAGSEDLGGGLKAGFNLNTDFFRPANLAGIAAFNGSSGSATTDATLSLSGGFGGVKAGLWESRSYAWDFGNVAPISLPVDLYDTSFTGTASQILQAAARDARIAYTTPSFGGFKFTALISERAYGVISGVNPEEGLSLAASYANGGLTAALALKSVNVKDRNSYQLGANYDFGGFKLGAGVDLAQRGANADDRIGYLVSAAAPLGPVTVGATYAQSDLTGDPAVAALGVDYALSKRTSLNASAGKFLGDNLKDAYQGQYRVKLVHNF